MLWILQQMHNKYILWPIIRIIIIVIRIEENLPKVGPEGIWVILTIKNKQFPQVVQTVVKIK